MTLRANRLSAGGVEANRVVVRLLAIALLVVASPLARAQAEDPFGPGGAPQPQGNAPKEEEYVRPKEALEPLPEPLSPDEEKARERAKQRGVLVSDKPKAGFISEVRIEGSRKIEPDAVLVQVQSRIDKRPDARVIQQDIRRIYAMDIFDDVVVESRPGPNDSIVLIFRLREKPAVDEVIIEGNKDVSKEDITEVIDIKPFQVLDPAKVKANVAKIQKLYVDKGYFLAEVTSEIRKSTGTSQEKGNEGLLDLFKRDNEPAAAPPAQPGEEAPPARPEQQGEGEFVDVVFHVAEAAKVRIERVTFVGNEHVSADELTQFMRTHEAHPLGVMNEWGTYKADALDTDLLAIEQIYQDKGYINVKVGKPRVELTPDKTRLAIEIPITEGKSYKLRSLTVKGDLIVDKPEDAKSLPNGGEIFFVRDEMLARTKIRPGDVFSRTQIAIDVNSIADRYRDKGYANVNIAPEPVMHDDDQTVDLALNIEAGPRVKVERIDITGNNKTQDSVIRRELRIYEGEWYSASALRISEGRVNALGFFEKVNVTTRPGSRPDRMVLVFDVKEKSTGTFQLGAGFSSAENILFTGQISYNNFLGLGTTVSGSVQWSSLRRIFDFRYVDPYAFYIGQNPVTLAFSAFNQSRFFLDFTRDSTGLDATIGYPIGTPFAPLTANLLSEASSALLPYIPNFENLQLFVAATLERVVIDDSNFKTRLIGLQTNLPRWTTSIRTSVVFDQRNNRLFPSAGWFLQGSVELAHPYLGSALMPGAERALKESLQNAGVKDYLGRLYKNGVANEFQRYSLTARAYMNFDEWSPVKGVVLKGNLEAGFINSNSQLVFENFYMGGFNTIRGYFLRSISPVARVGPSDDPSQPLSEFRIGGNKQIFSNIELEFPILEQVGIRGVFFFDAGNVYGNDESFFYLGDKPNPLIASSVCEGGPCWDPRTELPLGLFYSVGAGIRWFSPIGPLRFELGFPLTRRPVDTFGFRQGDQPYQFEFNVGNSF
jgi:outer membrane protein insertion porin family